MAKGMSMPYGDIFFASTPTIDRWSQQLYVEQKQREARAQQEGAILDANLQKELGKVRSIDTPEVVNSYQKYKQLKKELLFNKSLQKDPIAYNQLQQSAAKAYQDIFTTSNKSAELNDMSKRLTAEWMKNPNDHPDDFGAKMNALMNTPISGLTQPHPQYGDLTNMESYIDRSINTDFGKLLRDAVGQPKQVYSKTEPVDGGLQFKVTPYNYANTPMQVKEYLVGSMGMRQAGKDAAKAWDRLPEEEIASTIKQFQELPADYWQKIGLDGPQDLFPKNPDSKAENFASYQAMKYAIANAPKEGAPQFRQNLKAIKDLDFARDLRMQAIKQADAKDLIKYKKEIDPNDTEMNNVWYQRHLDNIIEDANSRKDRHHVYTTKGRSLYYYNVIKPDAFTMKAFQRGSSEPDRLGVTESGEIVPIFYKYVKDEKGNSIIEKTKDGKPVIDEEYSQPISYDQALINLGYRGRTKKQLGEDLNNKMKPKVKQNDPLGLF